MDFIDDLISGTPLHETSDISADAKNGMDLVVQELLMKDARKPAGKVQVFIRVAGYLSGLKAVRELLKEIKRSGIVELSTNDEETLWTDQAMYILTRSWSRDFGCRPRARDAVHLVASMPSGASPETFGKCVRKWVSSALIDYQTIYGIDATASVPCAHVVINTFNWKTRRRLRLNPREILNLRRTFAEAGRAEGLSLVASVKRKKRRPAAIQEMPRDLRKSRCDGIGEP